MRFDRFLPITKVDDEQRMVWGYASTGALDLDGEVIKVEAIKAALPGYLEWGNIREMHTASAVGVAAETTMDAKGLWLGAHISDDNAWKKCKPTTLSDGTTLPPVYKGFSIGGSVRRKVGNHIEALDLIEISLVDRPANPECRIEMVKEARVLSGGEATLVPITKLETGDITSDEVPDIGLFQRALRKLGMRLGVVSETAAAPALVVENTADTTEQAETSTESDGGGELAKSLYTLARTMDSAQAMSFVSDELTWESGTENGDTGDLVMAQAARQLSAQLLQLVSDMALHESTEMATHTDKVANMTPEQILKAKKDMSEAKDRLESAKKRTGDAQMCRSAAAKSAGQLATLLADQLTKTADAAASKGAPPILDINRAAELVGEIAKSLTTQMDHLDMIDLNIGKAASVVFSGEAAAWTTGVVSEAPGLPTPGIVTPADGPTSGKAADGTVTKAEADLMVELAVLRAENQMLKSAPVGGGRRPATFDPGNMADILGKSVGKSDMELLMQGVVWDKDNPESRATAAGRVIGNMIANSSKFARRITDPSFHGAAG